MLLRIDGPVFGHRNGTIIEVDQADGERMLAQGGKFVTELVDGRPAAARPSTVAVPEPTIVVEPTVEVEPEVDDEYLPDAADDDDADDAVADALAVVDSL